MAEREGFEPPDPCGSTVFKTAAFDHSAISPLIKERELRGPSIPSKQIVIHFLSGRGSHATHGCFACVVTSFLGLEMYSELVIFLNYPVAADSLVI